jgi:polyisoprenyl-teichoic acid--peptidoglycan teichoic acid transferase
VLVGLLFGVGLQVVFHRIFTGNAVVQRPAANGAFTWPLRLARRANVLLIGVDVTINAQRQVVPTARADTLMLVTFDPTRQHVGLLSVPRDIRMTIPELGETKINATYAFGGPGLTIRAVEDLLGVPVHYYVKLGPQSFARIIDALGGIEIDVEKDMQYTDTWAGLYINLKQGLQLLSGEQAMHYIRWRSDEQGDLGRVQRQQKVLLAVLKKLHSRNARVHAPKLLAAFAKRTETNLNLSELMTLGLFATELGFDDIHTATVPGEVGLVYVEPDLARTRPIVTEMFLGIAPAMLEQTSVEVLNGSDVPGLARQTALRLERLGFRIVRVENAPQPAQTTTIIRRSGRPEVAQALVDLLGAAVTRQAGDGPDFTIVVARDIALIYPVRAAAARN